MLSHGRRNYESESGKKQYPSGTAGVCDRRCQYRGKKEGEGPLGTLFDMVGEDDLFGCKTWEEAESNLQKDAVYMVMEKAGWKAEDVSYLFAGDLLGQCIATSFGIAAYILLIFRLHRQLIRFFSLTLLIFVL